MIENITPPPVGKMLDLRKVKGEKSRQRIMNAAIKIIEDKGIKGLSTRTVAKAAGLSQSSLYHHFDDLETILLEAMSQRIRRVINLSQLQPYGSLREYFVALFEEIWANVKPDHAAKSYVTFFERAVFDDTFHSRMIKLATELQGELMEKIKEILDRPIDPKTLEYIGFSLVVLREGFIAFMHMNKGQGQFSDPVEKARQLFGQLGDWMEAIADEA